LVSSDLENGTGMLDLLIEILVESAGQLVTVDAHEVMVTSSVV